LILKIDPLSWVVLQEYLLHLDDEVVSLLHSNSPEALSDTLYLFELSKVRILLELFVPNVEALEDLDVFSGRNPFCLGYEFLNLTEDFVLIGLNS